MLVAMSYRITLPTTTVECDTPAEVLALTALIDKPACSGDCKLIYRNGTGQSWPRVVIRSVEPVEPGEAPSEQQPVADPEPAASPPEPEPLAKPTATPKPRKSVVYDEPDDDFEEDPEPPRRTKVETFMKPMAPSDSDPLAEKIAKLLAKEGALGIATIAISIDQPTRVVKDLLRTRPDLFRLHPRAGGWELVKS